ncbi:MAG: FG-GAP-like repeat-containing protein [Candidatus Eisenbacteria bacterium]
MRTARTAGLPVAALWSLGLLIMTGGAEASPARFDTWRGFGVGSVDDAMFPADGKAADFDGDGYPDLAVVHYWQRPKLTILRNNGDGTYGEPTHYPAQVSRFLETGDFNGDLHEDIVVSNYGDAGQLSSISFYYNQGDGTFAPPQTLEVGRRPREMFAADFDRDGDLDLAVARIGTVSNPITDVAVLTNDGAGNFTLNTFLAGEQDQGWTLRTWNLTGGDLNADAYPDLVIGHAFQHCSVLLNDGAGGFLPPTTYVVGAGPWGIDDESGVALVDADHDGDLDLAFSCIYMKVYTEGDPGAVALFRNQGDGTMGPPEVIPLIAYSTGSANLEVADVTGDGWDDILLGWEGGGELGWGVLPADGLGGFGATRRYPGGDSPTAVCPVDVDGDLDLDVVVPSRGSMMVSVHLNPGNGEFATPSVTPVEGFRQRHFDAGDIDNDGDLDLVFCGGGYGSDGWIQVVRNVGSGIFVSAERFDLPNVARSVRVRDLDGDGWSDLVWADDPSGPPYDFKTIMNLGDGTFAPYRNWTVGTCGTRDLQTIDIDHDGDLDIVLGEYLSWLGTLEKYLYIRRNRGDGTFTPTELVVGDGLGASGITSGDFNEDGFVDLAVTNPLGVTLYPGNAAGTFGIYQTVPMEFAKVEIRSADLNGDLHDDLIVQGSSLRILLGRGDGSFEPEVDYEVDPGGTTALDIGDVDGDGDIDVILANYYAHDASVFCNRGDGTFTHERYGTAGKVVDVQLADFTGNKISDLCFATTGDHYPLGVFGPQIVRGLATAPADVDPFEETPLLQLAGGSPNPFSQTTTLTFVIPESGPVLLAIYDAQGRRIRTLVDGLRTAGAHSARWDGRDGRGVDAPAGVYFARLRAPGGAETARAIVCVD